MKIFNTLLALLAFTNLSCGKQHDKESSQTSSVNSGNYVPYNTDNQVQPVTSDSINHSASSRVSSRLPSRTATTTTQTACNPDEDPSCVPNSIPKIGGTPGGAGCVGSIGGPSYARNQEQERKLLIDSLVRGDRVQPCSILPPELPGAKKPL